MDFDLTKRAVIAFRGRGTKRDISRYHRLPLLTVFASGASGFPLRRTDIC